MLFSLILFCFIQCKKNTNERVNIKLKNKPLGEIKLAIQGKWQLHYSYGGITGNIRQNHTNSFIELKPTNSIYWDDNNNLIVKDLIRWKRKIDMVGDSTFIMSFCEMRGAICYAYSCGVQGIRNDTLILYDDATDPDGYYLTRK